MTRQQIALSLLELGINVFPTNDRKIPTVPWKVWQRNRVKPAMAEKWWGNNPEWGIAAVCGKISNIVVVDIETADNAREFEEEFGLSPHVKTGGGGYHFYFRHPGIDIPNKIRFRENTDFKSDGGYVIIPPSGHPSGGSYTWVNEIESVETLPPLPAQLLEELTIGDSAGLTQSLSEGNRDAGMASKIGRLVRTGMGIEDVMSLAMAWNDRYCNPPLDDSQVKKIVKSIHERENGKRTREEAKKVEFKVHSFEEIYEQFSNNETAWVVEDWLPEASCGLVISDPGMYKTWLMLDMAISIATGKPFLGTEKVNVTGPVLVIQQEDPYPMLFQRMAQIMNIGKVDKVGNGYVLRVAPKFPEIYFHTERRLRFDNSEIMEQLTDRIKQIRPRQVFIDPLYSAANMDDYMAKSAQNMLELKTIRDKYRVGFLINHHKKRSTKDAGRERDSLWGSQFLNAWLETGWQITGSDVSDVSVTRHFKNSATPSPVNLGFQIDDKEGTYKVEIIGKEDSLDILVSEFIEKEVVTSVQQICDHFNISSKARVHRVLKKINASKYGDRYVLPNRHQTMMDQN